MNFIKNMKLGVRLAVGFGTTLILMLALGAVSYQRLGELNQEIKDATNIEFPKTVQANNVIDAINAIARHLRNAYIYSGAEQQQSIDNIPAERKVINDNLEKLDKSIASVKGREMLKKVADARAAYVVDQDKFLELLKAD